jgi:hypothetical protein
MLAKRLRLTLPTVQPEVANRLADWCAHEFRADRYRYLVFFNTASLYPVLTHGRGVMDDHDLIERFTSGLQSQMTGTELEFYYQRWIAPELMSIQYAAIPDRSTMGSMNDLITMAKYHLKYRDESPVDLSFKMATAPMGMLGMDSPDKAFRDLRGNA